MFTIPFSVATAPELENLAQNAPGSAAPWQKDIWRFIQHWHDNQVTAIEVQTSGSTGVPKKISHAKSAMAASAQLTCSALHLQQGDKALLCLPANKIGGIMMLVRCMVQKMDLHCIQPAANPFSALPEGLHLQFAAFTPMQVMAANTPEAFKKLDSIDNVLLGGEQIPAQLQPLLQRLTNNTYATFGMTETISHIALKKLTGGHQENTFTALPGVEVDADEEGRLVVNAPNLNIHHLTTNDLIEITAPHKFNWLGRTDNVINSGGIKIIAEDVEERLQGSIPLPFFIGAIPHALTGQAPVIVLQAAQLSPNQLAQVQQAVQALGKYEKPRKAILVEAFIKTPNGKINRKETLQQQVTVISLQQD